MKKTETKYLTEQDFRDALSNDKVSKFVSMLTSNLYSFRVKEALFLAEKIEAKDFLYNENIFELPLAVKGKKGEVLIDNSLLDVFDRFLLAEGLSQKGDALTAFMVDHDDTLYTALKINIKSEDKITEQDYVQIFSDVYKRTSDILLEDIINKRVESSEKLNEYMLLHENLN